MGVGQWRLKVNSPSVAQQTSPSQAYLALPRAPAQSWRLVPGAFCRGEGVGGGQCWILRLPLWLSLLNPLCVVLSVVPTTSSSVSSPQAGLQPALAVLTFMPHAHLADWKTEARGCGRNQMRWRSVPACPVLTHSVACPCSSPQFLH